MSHFHAQHVSIHLAALPFVLLAFLFGQSQAATTQQELGAAEVGPCPTWFHRAARLGPGRPEAVPLGGLKEVTLCRYFGNPNSANGADLPPNNKLAAEKMIGQSLTARSLGHSFNRLRPYPTQDAPYPDGQPPMHLCSSEFGGGFYLRFL